MTDTKPLGDATVKSRWTSADEARLIELTQRRERIMKENRFPLEDLLNLYAASLGLSSPGRESSFSTSEAVDFMVANAERLTELLKPFVEVRA